ncbi:MAG: hypothetical protein LBV52_06470 [Spirochaetaceae bacterium]|jgi:hypothetical protein|nr:hypothetical protein [Spirochaetaceae bacterium]
MLYGICVFRGNEKIFTELTGMGDLSSLAELFEGTKLAQIWEKQGIEKGIQTGIQEQRKNDLNILNSCSNLEEAKAKLMSM